MTEPDRGGVTTRIDVPLPPFVRTIYVDDAAAQIWSRRLWRIAHAWRQIERASVGKRGVRACAFVRVLASDLATLRNEVARDGLRAQPLPAYRALIGGLSDTRLPAPASGSAAGPGMGPDNPRRARIEVAIGEDSVLNELEGAFMGEDGDAIGALLGYPACCRAFFDEVHGRGVKDPVWWYATRSQADGASPRDGAERDEHRDTGPRGAVAGFLAVRADARLNILLTRLGVRAVPHVPCSAHCSASLQVAADFARLGQALGYGEELEWRADLLAWPMAWSMLHGIAELETPLFKMACNTDGTGEKYVVHWLGDRYPVTAAQGLYFPYRRPHYLRVSDSKSYSRGLLAPHSLVRGRADVDDTEQ